MHQLQEQQELVEKAVMAVQHQVSDRLLNVL